MWPLLLITIISAVLTALLAPTQKAKRGNLKDFSFPQINDGDPIQYIAGTVKITAPGLTWYGDYQTRPIKKSSGLFSTTTVGYKYFLGWQLVFCIGPNVHLKKLWFGTKSGTSEEDAQENDPNFTNPDDPKVPTPIYSGDMTTGQLHLVDDSAFGGDTGGGGYDLTVEFFGGEQNQPKSLYLQSKVQGFVPPYRGVCHIIAAGYIGNATTLQTMNAELTRIPDPLGLGVAATVGVEGDANPANVLVDLFTNNFGAASIPVSRINIDSFISGGLTLKNEDEGISIASGSSAAAISGIIQDILKQIEGTVYEDPETGLISLCLFRADYDVETVLEISEDNIISISNYATNLWSDTKNRVRIKFQDRHKDYNDRVALGDDLSNISFQGGQVKGITVDQPYVKRRDHANRKVASSLATYSTPLTKMTAQTHRVSTTLHPGSVIKLNYPEYNVGQIVFRVTKVNYGDLINNYLSLDLAADKFAKTEMIYAAPFTNFARPFTGVSPILAYTLDETPRWFNAVQPAPVNPDAARIMVYPFRPNPTQQAFNVWNKVAGEADYLQTNSDQDYADFASTRTTLTATSTQTTLDLQAITNSDVLAEVSSDQIRSAGLNLIQIDDEIMGYETFVAGTGTTAYTLQGLHRALLDTVRASHAANAIVTFLNPSQVTQREFGGGDTVDVKMGSISAAGAQSVDDAIMVAVHLQHRAERPYPPVAISLDGVLQNPNVDNSSGVAVTWKRRDRLKSTISFEEDADEAPEAGTEYFVLHNGVATSLGTGTAGSFTFDLAGLNYVEFFAKLNGLESIHVGFTTTVAHASGVQVQTSLATANASPPTGSEESTNGGSLGTAFTTAPTATGGPLGVMAHGDIGAAATVAPTATGGLFGTAVIAHLATATTGAVTATESAGDSDALDDGSGSALSDGLGGTLGNGE